LALGGQKCGRRLDGDVAHEGNESSGRTALRLSHFLRLGSIRTLVSDLHAVWGDSHFDKFAHTKAYMGLEILHATRNDRKERGRVVWIE